MFERWKAARKEKQEREALKARKVQVTQKLSETSYMVERLEKYILKRWGPEKVPTPEEREKARKRSEEIAAIREAGGSVDIYYFPEKIEEDDHRRKLKELKKYRSRLKEELKAIIEREEKENW